jgi:hypothetical protein
VTVCQSGCAQPVAPRLQGFRSINCCRAGCAGRRSLGRKGLGWACGNWPYGGPSALSNPAAHYKRAFFALNRNNRAHASAGWRGKGLRPRLWLAGQGRTFGMADDFSTVEDSSNVGTSYSLRSRLTIGLWHHRLSGGDAAQIRAPAAHPDRACCIFAACWRADRSWRCNISDLRCSRNLRAY